MQFDPIQFNFDTDQFSSVQLNSGRHYSSHFHLTVQLTSLHTSMVPKMTCRPSKKLSPMMMTVAPPVVQPSLGLMALMQGAATPVHKRGITEKHHAEEGKEREREKEREKERKRQMPPLVHNRQSTEWTPPSLAPHDPQPVAVLNTSCRSYNLFDGLEYQRRKVVSLISDNWLLLNIIFETHCSSANLWDGCFNLISPPWQSEGAKNDSTDSAWGLASTVQRKWQKSI